MFKTKITKLIIYIALTVLLTITSFYFRNLLIENFDGYNFKLISIEHIKNYGAAFSLLQNHTTLLIVICLIILLFTLFYIIKNIETFSKQNLFLTSLLSAGIICNLAERLLDGYVTDYLRLNFIAFPIFNISDVFICTGAFILICNILFNNDKQN